VGAVPTMSLGTPIGPLNVAGNYVFAGRDRHELDRNSSDYSIGPVHYSCLVQSECNLVRSHRR
jgi:hypothetical protein